MRSTAIRAMTAAALTGAIAAVVPALPAQAITCPTPGGGTMAPAPEAAPDAEVVFSGNGYGHNLGMSQYGAQGAARLGCTAPQILAAYFPGTRLVKKAMPAEVRLWMGQDGTYTAVAATGGQVQWLLDGCAAPCPPVQPMGTTWEVHTDAARTRFELVDAATRTVVWSGGATGSTLRVRHSGTVIGLTTYGGKHLENGVTRPGGETYKHTVRWDETRFTFSAAGLDSILALQDNAAGPAMDKYLWGLSEVPISWTNGSHEALRAQSIAARNYAAAKGGAVLYPTQRDQVYRGYVKELADEQFRDSAGRNLRWQAAVNSTSGQVVVDSSDRVITAFFTSSHGGHGEDDSYVWGGKAPYIRAIDDSRWDAASSNPYRSWSASFSLAEVASKLGFDTIESMTVAPWGTAARDEGVQVTGVLAGVRQTRAFQDFQLKRALGLRSPSFTVKVLTVGGGTAVPLTGDWDGDGDTDLGWWKAGAVALRLGDGTTHRFRYGRAGDVPVVGDWDGDGKDSLGTYRAGRWSLRNAVSAGKADVVVRYAPPATTGRPVVGDWNGDGKDSLGFVHGTAWHVRNDTVSGKDHKVIRYGAKGDVPVVGDWDGNGTDTPGVRRAGTWRLRNTFSSGKADVTFSYGGTGYRPIVGDWDGDGRTSAGAVRGIRWHATDSLTTAKVEGGAEFRG